MADESRPREPWRNFRFARIPGPARRRTDPGSVRLRARRPWVVPASFGGLALVVALLVVVPFWASFSTERWWYSDLGFRSVWWTIRSTQMLLGLVGGGIAFFCVLINLSVADRVLILRPRLRGRRARLIRIGSAVLVAVLTAPWVASGWQEWLLMRNGRDFGVEDARFGLDAGFYVFDLPFISFAVAALNDVFVTTLLLVVVWYFVKGGFAQMLGTARSERGLRDLYRGDRATTHVCVLGGAVSLIWAAEYVLRRFELAWSSPGPNGFGPGYVDDRIRMRGYQLLALVAVVVAGVLFTSARRGAARLAIAAVAGWIVVAFAVGVLVPIGTQVFVVDQDIEGHETEYAGRNLTATLSAYDIAKVQRKAWSPASAVDVSDVLASLAALRQIALWDGATIPGTVLRSSADMNRRTEAGQTLPIVSLVTARGPLGSNATWSARYVELTHSLGVQSWQTNRISPTGGAVPWLGGPIPKQPRVYIGENESEYAIVGGSGEQDPDGSTYRYEEPSAGVSLNSWWRKLAFAIDLGDRHLLFSDEIDRTSRVIAVRNPADRVRAVAPFLDVDSDPYLVTLDRGLAWVVDTYTSTYRYPFSAALPLSATAGQSGLHQRLNYVRNPVTAVVDAYSGRVGLYVTDPNEPILRAWREALPLAFLPGDRMEKDYPGIATQLRYPGDLFAAQSAMYARFRVGSGANLVSGASAWLRAPVVSTDLSSVSAKGTAPSDVRAPTIPPRRIQHRLFTLPGKSAALFGATETFVARDGLGTTAGLFVADASRSEKRPLYALELEATDLKRPNIEKFARDVSALPEVVELKRAAAQSSTQVAAGGVSVLPVGRGMLFVRTYAVIDDGVATVRLVTLSDGTEVVAGSTIGRAMAKLVGAAEVAGWIDDNNAVVPSAGELRERSPQELLDEAAQALTSADEALSRGDLGQYQLMVDEARRLVSEAQAALARAEAGK